MMIGAKRKFGCDACNNNSESVARNDNFFQPHMKSQVTQKLVNQQNEDTMKEVELQTLSKLKSGVSHYYKLLKNPNNTNSEEKPMKRELLRPSIVYDVNATETKSGDFACCNSDPCSVKCYYCNVMICTASNTPCGLACTLCKQFFCHKCRCENLCLGCS